MLFSTILAVLLWLTNVANAHMNESSIQGEIYFSPQSHQIYMSTRMNEVEVISATSLDGHEIVEWRSRLLRIPLGAIVEVVDQSDGITSFSFDLEGMLERAQSIKGLPNLIKIRTSDVQKLKLLFVGTGDIEAQPLPMIVAGDMSESAPMRYCLRDVRIYASQHCSATVVIVERAAIAMQAYLATGKWRTITRAAWSEFPKCTACFYDGGRQDCDGGTSCGHTAIKTGRNRWKGAGVHSAPNIIDKDESYYLVERTPLVFQGCIIPDHLYE